MKEVAEKKKKLNPCDGQEWKTTITTRDWRTQKNDPPNDCAGNDRKKEPAIGKSLLDLAL